MLTSCSRRHSFHFALTLALTFSLTAVSWPRPQRAANQQVSGAADVPAEAPAAMRAETEQRARKAYGKLGVSFEENRGQTDRRVRYLARHGGATVFLANDEAAFVLRAPESHDSAAGEKPSPGRAKSHAVRMKFEGANPRAEVSGERELSGRVNYFRGNDPSKWRTNVRTYGAVRYRGLYEGVDLVYYGNERGEMEYDLVVAPGADPSRISLKIEGAKSLEVDAAGDLVINTPAGEMRQRKPTVYQEVNGARREVAGGYVAEPDGSVRFALGEYDRSAPLVIDPVLEYSTYLGGSKYEEGHSIAVDPAGNAYVTGLTRSFDFPTVNPVQGTRGGSSDDFTGSDAFVTKLNAAGNALVYSTYLGGSNYDNGFAIAVDSAGNAYVTGATASSDFPTANPMQSTNNSFFGTAFVAKLNAAGNALVYSTYLGGGHVDRGSGIAVDSAGNAYVTGGTVSSNFPTVNPAQGTMHGSGDAFVAKLNAAGSALIYSTYLGGGGEDAGSGIAVDAAGNAYVTGTTRSFDFPTVNPIQSTNSSNFGTAFVAKLNAAGSAFVYATYLGGHDETLGFGIAVDAAGNAYVTGLTLASDFPTVHPIQTDRVDSDAFVTKLNAAGSAFIYSTYLGGGVGDVGTGIAVNPAGEVYVTGYTNSPNFPTVNPVQSTTKGTEDAFLTKLNAAGSAFVYSTYLGGDDGDEGHGIAVDSAGDAYVMGITRSLDFPTVNPIQGTHGGGGQDAFVTKFSFVSIQGRVITSGATGVVGVPWVTIKRTGTDTITKLTDAHGYYSFTGLPRGEDYTLTVSKNHLSFVPASRTFTDLDANLSDVNFTVPSLSVNNVTVTEGNAGEVTATFTVKLKPASGKPVTVNYQTIGGATNSATDGADYTALPPTTLTFTRGQTVKTVTVKVKGDTLDEANETFRLLLNGPTNALISDNIGVCTITDDD